MKQVRSNGITTTRQVGSSASSRRPSDAGASRLETAALAALTPHQGGSLALLEQYPQSHATSSLAPTPYDGEDGDRDQPIDLTEEDDVEVTGSEPSRPVAGPSRLRDAPSELLFAENFSSPRPAAPAPPVRIPRRPDLSVETSFQPEYRWLNSGRASPALSSTSSQDSRRSRTSSSAGRGARDASAGRSNLRAQLKNSPRKSKAGRRRVALDIFGAKFNNMKKRAWTKPPWLANNAKLAEQAHGGCPIRSRIAVLTNCSSERWGHCRALPGSAQLKAGYADARGVYSAKACMPTFCLIWFSSTLTRFRNRSTRPRAVSLPRGPDCPSQPHARDIVSAELTCL